MQQSSPVWPGRYDGRGNRCTEGWTPRDAGEPGTALGTGATVTVETGPGGAPRPLSSSHYAGRVWTPPVPPWDGPRFSSCPPVTGGAWRGLHGPGRTGLGWGYERRPRRAPKQEGVRGQVLLVAGWTGGRSREQEGRRGQPRRQRWPVLGGEARVTWRPRGRGPVWWWASGACGPSRDTSRLMGLSPPPHGGAQTHRP